MKEFQIDDIAHIAQEVLARAKAAPSHATIITLSGDLGAGKTTLTQTIARELGITESVISPTFVIMKIYELTNQNWKHLVHIDAYRLDKEGEMLSLGWDKIISDPENLVLVEWPERIAAIIPKTTINVHLAHHGDTTRTVQIEYNE